MVVVAAAEVVVVAAVVGSGFVGGQGTKGTVSFDSHGFGTPYARAAAYALELALGRFP